MIKVSVNHFASLCFQRYSEYSLRKNAVFGKQTNDFTFEKEGSFNLKTFGKFIKHFGTCK